MKINILETTTKEGDITIARKRYLKTQIKALDVQCRNLKAPVKWAALIDHVAYVNNKETLSLLIRNYKLELSNYYDTSEEYNS